MALTLTIIPGHGATSVVAGQTVRYVASVTNSGSSSVTLQGLAAYADTANAISVGQPEYLTPNVPVGVGNPTLTAGSTYYYPFSVTFQAPYFAGPSPQTPGGTQGSQIAAPVDSQYVINLQSLSSDSTVASAQLLVPVLSTIAPFPIAQGGGMQLSSGFNLVNLLTSFG